MTSKDSGAPALRPDLPFSAAAERNAAPILSVLERWLPSGARVLELASGTGQHAERFAAAHPDWDWQPSEAQESALPHLAARCGGLPNVRRPLVLDVRSEPWPVEAGVFDAVYVANLLHISPWEAGVAFLRGAARCLRPLGSVVVYGPFIVEGEPLAPSNVAFDADLRRRDARWGLRVLQAVEASARDAGLVLEERQSMPANNLMLRLRQAG